MSNSSSKATRTGARLGNWVLLLLVTLATLWLADRIFRAYEQSQLLPQLPDPQGSTAVNLQSLRYNDTVVERSTSEDEFRILSFGDSFAYSVMDADLSYSGLLEKELQATVPNHRFRVVNLGEPATGTRQYRESHRYWSEILKHQGVLFLIFIGNDLLDDSYLYSSVEWQPNRAVLEGGNAILEPGNPRVPVKFPLRMFDYAYAWLMSVRNRSDEALPPGYNWAGLTDFDRDAFFNINRHYLESFDVNELPALLPGYEQVLLLMQHAQGVVGQGIPVAVAIGPSELQINDELRAEVLAHSGTGQDQFDMQLPQRIIRRLQEAHAPDVPLFDMTADFRAYSQASGEGLFFRRNTHWDMQGNRLAGEVIAKHLREEWFDQDDAYQAPKQFLPLPRNELLDEEGIDAYLARLTGQEGSGGVRVSGAVRAIHMLDGVSDQRNNWAIAPLNQAVLLRFTDPQALTSIRIHLLDSDGRAYRYSVEVENDGAWKPVSGVPESAVSGVQELVLDGQQVSALRIIGLESTASADSSTGRYLLIHEIEWTQAEAESGY